MVKLVFLCRRRPDIGHEAYVERLLRGHVPIALRHHPSMRRYVVNVVVETHGEAPPLDSIGELWFDSLDDYRERLYDSPEGREVVARDVAGFLGSADAYVTVERVQRDAPRGVPLGERSPGLKVVVAVRRAREQTHAAFVEHWIERHVPLVLADPNVRTYKNDVIDECLSGPPYDGIAELRFDSPADWEAHVRLSRDERGAIAADLRRFKGVSHAYRVEEYVQR
jgi:uncharacterized protein (TIGR02118 family)